MRRKSTEPSAGLVKQTMIASDQKPEDEGDALGKNVHYVSADPGNDDIPCPDEQPGKESIDFENMSVRNAYKLGSADNEEDNVSTVIIGCGSITSVASLRLIKAIFP